MHGPMDVKYLWSFVCIIWKIFVIFLHQIVIILLNNIKPRRHGKAQSVEVLRYKPEGRGFDYRWVKVAGV